MKKLPKYIKEAIQKAHKYSILHAKYSNLAHEYLLQNGYISDEEDEMFTDICDYGSDIESYIDELENGAYREDYLHENQNENNNPDNNKLEVGMFIRDGSSHGIQQISDFILDDRLVLLPQGHVISQNYDFLDNATHNLIDLIIEGDYINGLEVCKITQSPQKTLWFNNGDSVSSSDEISKVLTKEQIESYSISLTYE